MQITLDIPDGLAVAITARGCGAARTALEAIALEADRQRRLSGYQLRVLLGIASRDALGGVLKERQVYNYMLEDSEKDLAANRELRARQKADAPA